MEPGGMLLDVGFNGQEILMNEFSGLRVLVGLGIQPSACPSGRRRAEVQQNRAGLLLRSGKCLIDVPAPVDGHGSPPSIMILDI
jgi:hypothetical protein